MALTVNERLLDRTVLHHVSIQRVASSAVQQIISILQSSNEDVFNAILRRVNSHGKLTPAQVNRVVADVQNINDDAYLDVWRILAQNLGELADYEVEFLKDLIEEVLPFDWALTRPQKKFVDTIVHEEPCQGGLMLEWVEGLAQGHFTRLRTAIRSGAAIDHTGDEIVRSIRGHRNLNFRDGVVDVTQRSVQRTVNTLYNHIANRARETLLRENLDIVKTGIWTAVLDDATCEECGGLDGTEIDMEDIAAQPPLHPNCRCMLSPVILSWDDMDLDSPDAENMRRQLDGKPPQKLTYQRWLERQSMDAQDEILGKERASLFRRGLPLKKFVDHTGRRYTLPELRRVEGKMIRRRATTTAQTLAVTTKRRNYGYKPDLPDRRDNDWLYALKFPEDVQLPPRVSLREQMPPIFDQGNLGSCVANACVAAMMFAHGPKTPMLSRLDLYYKARLIENNVESDDGCEIRDAIKALVRWGVCTEATWPYKIRKFRQAPPAQAGKEDDQWKATEYFRMKTHEDFMKCLASGYPFIGGFSVYESFDGKFLTDKGVMEVPRITEKLVGGHAILVTGYDTNFKSSQVFKSSGLDQNDVPDLMYEVRNSFGSDWGLGGYYWMPAEYLENRDLADDFWTIRT